MKDLLDNEILVIRLECNLGTFHFRTSEAHQKFVDDNSDKILLGATSSFMAMTEDEYNQLEQ